MKVRKGFISNSSTTSFLIYGVQVFTEEEIDYKLLKKLSLEYYVGESEHYVGRSWGDVEDNETGKEFKDRIITKIDQIKNKYPDVEMSSPDTFEEAYYDG